ncbi:non-specific protein-tyrosine kinase [Acanthamoeba castellanii str. Neff]|uniref:Non-specific protein-tyrosine kinase n=1 Tax=Acanthamoeba castellanii (strain ATCC 30010 / Neff) TaxID=1257118 RepID=L8GR81_ACACF|nr:non-specific protein-tyrosine kinase [Acanthamoeba castellanii str. Neff]ELR15649.1 non-specific protein-tyrosine kinase [Acanthamoeba castellanii str. Neff]
MVLEILGLELYSNLARKKILKPWKKAALLTFYLCVIAQAVVRIVLTYHKDLGAKYVLNRYIPVLLSYTISILLVLHWYCPARKLNKIKRQVYRIWQMGFIVLGYLGFFFVVWLQVNYAVRDQASSAVDKFYAVIFSLLNMVLVIVCVFIFVSYRNRFGRLTRSASTTAKYCYFGGCVLWVGLIAIRVFVFDILSYYVFDVLHSETLVFANEVLPIFVAIAIRKAGDLLLKRDDYESMRDAGMPGFVAMIDDGMSKPFQVDSFDALKIKVGTLLLYDKLLGEGRNSKVHEASLFVVSKLGLEDQENNYGVKVAVKLFNKPFAGSTRESEIVKKIGKQKGFIKYKGYIHTPDHRLGMVMKRCECGLMDIFRNYGLTYLDTLEYALQIAKAMQYLHHNRLIHRNLKVSNILAKRLSDGDNKWRLIISDFDLYKQPEQVPLPENTNQSYLKAYLPPEMLNKGNYSYSGDFWAYGWIVMEMTNACGFSTFMLNHLIIRCRLTDPDARMNFDTIIHKLEKLEERQGMDRKDKPLQKFTIEDGCDQLERQYSKMKKNEKKERMLMEKQKQKERERSQHEDRKRDKKRDKKAPKRVTSRGSVRGSDDDHTDDFSDSTDREGGSDYDDDGASSRRGGGRRGSLAASSLRESSSSVTSSSSSRKADKKGKKGKRSAAKEEEWERERERIRQKGNKSGGFLPVTSSFLPTSPRSVKEMGTKLTKLIDI